MPRKKKELRKDKAVRIAKETWKDHKIMIIFAGFLLLSFGVIYVTQMEVSEWKDRYFAQSRTVGSLQKQSLYIQTFQYCIDHDMNYKMCSLLLDNYKTEKSYRDLIWMLGIGAALGWAFHGVGFTLVSHR